MALKEVRDPVLLEQLNNQSSIPSEGIGVSLLKAPFRVGEDLLRGGANFIKNVPHYYEEAQTEVPGVINVLKEHPKHAALQGAAGLTEMVHNLLNFPHAAAEYGEKRLNLLPENFSEKIPYQNDISEGLNNFFGKPQYAGEGLIRGLGRNAINIGLGTNLVSALNPLKLSHKNIAKDVLQTAEQNKKVYSGLYNKLWENAHKEGISDLSEVAPYLDIDTLEKYSSKRSIGGVKDFIKSPTIENAHSAKSDLLRLQRDLEKQTTLRTAERKQLNAVKNGIEDIQSYMFKDQEGNVNNNLLNKYNTIQKGYAEEVVPYKNKMINKFKRNEISARELVNSLSRGEFAAKRGSFHPEIGIRNKLLPIFGTVAAGSLAKILYDNMMGQPSMPNE